jgi:predicted DNA-binding transcriptional regulator AlpA
MSSDTLDKTLTLREDLTFLTDAKVAEMLGISRQQLKVWRIQTPPQGPPITFFGRLVRYKLSDLRAWIASRPKTGGVE